MWFGSDPNSYKSIRLRKNEPWKKWETVELQSSNVFKRSSHFYAFQIGRCQWETKKQAVSHCFTWICTYV
jgi:hypothetical protein